MDIDFTLESLRKQWLLYPDRRIEIEQYAAALHQEREMILSHIPRSLQEHDRETPGMSATIIEAMIVGVATYLNIGKNIRPAQIQETAELLAANYPHLTLEHFAIVFQKAKLGEWGQIYDRLDGVVIADWIIKYTKEITEKRKLIRENEHLGTKNSRTADGVIYRLSDITSKFITHGKGNHNETE